jgi:YggT family protein
MANAFGYLINAIVSIVLFLFVMRLLLQLSRADFRNPMAKGMMQLTNWLIMPLRKVLPAIGRFDTASFVAVALIAAAGIALARLVIGAGLPPADEWLLATLRLVLQTVLMVYFFAILVSIIISWVAQGGYSPAHQLVDTLTTPVLRPIRSILPTLGGFDFSPVVVLLAIGFVQRLLGL